MVARTYPVRSWLPEDWAAAEHLPEIGPVQTVKSLRWGSPVVLRTSPASSAAWPRAVGSWS